MGEAKNIYFTYLKELSRLPVRFAKGRNLNDCVDQCMQVLTSYTSLKKMSGLSEDQIYEIQEVFSLFETRGSGKVEASKIGDILRALGLNPTEAEVKKLVSEVDANGGTTMPFQSFLPIYLAVCKKKDENQSTAEDFIEGFRVFDKDANGTISSAELRHLLTTLGEKMEEVDVENLIAPFEDQHGNINYEDFVKHILQSANQ